MNFFAAESDDSTNDGDDDEVPALRSSGLIESFELLDVSGEPLDPEVISSWRGIAGAAEVAGCPLDVSAEVSSNEVRVADIVAAAEGEALEDAIARGRGEKECPPAISATADNLSPDRYGTGSRRSLTVSI